MSNINLGLNMQSLDLGTKKAAYTGVLLHAGKSEDGKDVDYMAGNESGQVIEVTIPNGTLALAYDILDRVKKRGFRYQPFESGTTIADPAIEIGDNVTVKGNNSVVMGIQTNHSRLMASTLKAPFDEEVNHEWKYVPRSERQFNRESAYTRSRLTITEGKISAEVVRATGAEEQLSSRITLNATEIAAKVSKSGGNSSSFGWTLTDSSWTLTSNNSTVLKATSTGIEITGKITATSGYIGNGASGFEIGNTYIRNGMTSRDDTTHNGVYIGTNGIALGAGNFKVDSSGNLTANSGTFRGNVSAGNIQYGVVGGVDHGTLNGSGLTDYSIGSGKYGLTSIGNGNMIEHTLNTGSMVSSIGTSLGYANFSNSVFTHNDAAQYMTAQYYFIRRNNADYSMSLHTHRFYVRDGYIYMSSNGGEDDSVDWTGGEQGFNIADTQYYKDAVSDAESVGWTNGYNSGKSDGYSQAYPKRVTNRRTIAGVTYSYVELGDDTTVMVPEDF